MNSNILAAKRSEFESKEAAAEVRRREKAVEEAAALQRKLEEEAESAAERHAKYQLALEREEARKQVGAGWANSLCEWYPCRVLLVPLNVIEPG
jgi:hypothetical protein